MKDNLDEINNKRVDTTKQRVAHAIRLLENPVGCLNDERLIDTALNDIARAVNLLESAEEEMRWACRHFGWDDRICDQIDGACADLGMCLSKILNKSDDEDEFDVKYAGYIGNEAVAKLGKALATLIRWFDDTQDDSEV